MLTIDVRWPLAAELEEAVVEVDYRVRTIEEGT